MEQPISSDNVIKKGVSVRTLYNNDSISIMQRLAPQFGVNVAILQKEGEEYTHHSTDGQTSKETIFRGLVPQGESYIGISSLKNDIHDFLEAVRAKEASRKNS